MKILLVADHEDEKVWNHWNAVGKSRFDGVDLILSAGDIKAAYLEFLVTMLNVPCLYVRGNHDQAYHETPPDGCICIEDGVIEVLEYEDTGRVMLKEDAMKRASGTSLSGVRTIRIAGLGGSMRYRMGSDMYTEKEMSRRAAKLKRRIRHGVITKANGKPAVSRDMAISFHQPGASIDILLTHAPCRGYGDMEDLPHNGFACFNDLLNELKPLYHCYGHVHMEYGNFSRKIQHPSGTQLVNVSGMYILEI